MARQNKRPNENERYDQDELREIDAFFEEETGQEGGEASVNESNESPRSEQRQRRTENRMPETEMDDDSDE